jgi:16S rRNA (uracil1498-N3)-methyltransferase
VADRPVRRVKVAGIGAEALTLGPEEAHYLTRVLRLPMGSTVCAFDGRGNEVEAVLVDRPTGPQLQPSGPVRDTPAPAPFHLFVALTKGPAMDLQVRMATELGVTAIHPVLAGRSVATGERIDRWLRIADAAARQCGRADTPEVRPILPFLEALQGQPDLPRRIAAPGASPVPAPKGGAVVWVGPEGGWTRAELDAALTAGCAPIGLGPHVLRADTAVAAALALSRPAAADDPGER